MRCPSCGGRDVRPSAHKGLLDTLLRAFHKRPFRCRGCSHRFHRYVPDDPEEFQAGENAKEEPKVNTSNPQ
jgi:hypothetical protein